MKYLSLYDAQETTLSGNARRVHDKSLLFGKAFFLKDRGDSLSLKLTGNDLGIVFLKHAWSGVAEVIMGDQIHRIDLYAHSPGHWLMNAPAPFGHEDIPVVIRPSGETPPGSQGNEVWVEGIYSAHSGISMEKNRRLQRAHVIRMLDDMEDREEKEKTLEIMHRRYSTYIEKLFLEGAGHILDVGCGHANVWFGHLRERGFTYYGVDLHEQVVEFMTDLVKCQGEDVYVKQGMLEDIPFPDQSFDVVYASHILEHTTDITRALSEIRRVMKDEGYLIFAVPCGNDDQPAHIHNREKEGWIEDLTNNGFLIEESGQFDFNLNEFYGRAVKASTGGQAGDQSSVLGRDSANDGIQKQAFSFIDLTHSDSLKRRLQITEAELRYVQQRLQTLEISLTWRIGQRLANTLPGRILFSAVRRVRG